MKTRAFALAGATVLSLSVAFAPVSAASPADFQKCLTQNGVNVQLPDKPPPPPKGSKPPKPGEAPPAPPGVDQSTWNTAFAACKQYAPAPPR